MRLFIGTAAWAIPTACRGRFADGPSILHRYASRLNAAEINTSFYRPHRRASYARWAESVGPGFRFAVKAPRTISHEKRLRDCCEEIARFAGEVGGLGTKLGAVLLQLPPSLAFDRGAASYVFERMTARVGAPLVCEPRHASWFRDEAERLFRRFGVARVAADPPPVPTADAPGGAKATVYLRLHGSPRMYESDYPDAALRAWAAELAGYAADGADTWCIFDNTKFGYATADALRLSALTGQCGPEADNPR